MSGELLSSTNKADPKNAVIATFLATLRICFTLGFLLHEPSPFSHSCPPADPSHHGSALLFLTEPSSIPALQPFRKHRDCYVPLLPLLPFTGTTSNTETPLDPTASLSPSRIVTSSNCGHSFCGLQKDPASSWKSTGTCWWDPTPKSKGVIWALTIQPQR